MKSPNSLSTSHSRCAYKSRSGRPCRYSALPHALFCKRHAPRPLPGASSGYDSLAAELAEVAGDFSSPAQVQNVMGKIFHALIRHRISPKEAGVLCYIAQTILHSHRVILLELKLKAEAKKGKAINWIHDLPTALRHGPGEDSGPDKLTWNLPRSSADLPNIPAPSCATSGDPASNSQESISAVHPDEQSSAQSQSPPDSSHATTSITKPPVPPPVVPRPMPTGYLNHFYPRDPTLAPGLQDPAKLAPPSPSQEDLDRRNARFARIHGYRR